MSHVGRILVIDDLAAVRDWLEAELTEFGCEVFCAENGREGIEMLGKFRVDLVITDMLMPVQDGVETIVEIRKSYPDLGIIATSSGGRLNNLVPLEIAEKMGANRTLTKPFSPQELVAAVEGQLAARSGAGRRKAQAPK